LIFNKVEYQSFAIIARNYYLKIFLKRITHKQFRSSNIPEFKADLIDRKLQATANDRHDVCLVLRTSKPICRINS